MEENKKSKKGLVAFIIILILVILGLVGYICYDKGLIFKTDKAVVKKEKKAVEKEIKDTSTKKELSKKINLLLISGYGGEYKEVREYSAYGFGFGVLKQSKLSEDEKQLIALRSIPRDDWEDINDNNWENIPEIKDIIDQEAKYISKEENLKSIKQISEEKINKISKELFGEKIKNPIRYIKDCPPYIYDKNTKTYYRLEPRCGGTNPMVVIDYKSKFIKKGKEAYVYVSYGYTAPKDMNDYHTFALYKDIDYKNSVEGLGLYYGDIEPKDVYKENMSNLDDAINLVKENYKEFSEYKYTFKKDKDGNYYFVSVKQTK